MSVEKRAFSIFHIFTVLVNRYCDLNSEHRRSVNPYAIRSTSGWPVKQVMFINQIRLESEKVVSNSPEQNVEVSNALGWLQWAHLSSQGT